MQQHTYEMGVIGNCAFMAHIDRTADVRWLCWPRFDSSFLFGGLLDKEKGGGFSIRPQNGNGNGGSFKTKQYYLENTNILCTEFDTPDGSYRVTDFAPRFLQYERYFKPLMLFRKVEPLSGNPRVQVSCRPVGSYGEVTPQVELGSNHIRYMGLDSKVRLTTNIPLNYLIDEKTFVLNETKYLVLSWGVPLEAPLESTAEEFFRKTRQYWRDWIRHSSVGSFQQEMVIRSALTLKMHQYNDTGAIVASGTTSLPEIPGQVRNWDYRYCWIRDAYYTLTAFNHIGHFEELESYAEYIQNVAISGKDRFQPVYGIDGRAELDERTVDLKGYQASSPVRVGNQAYTHIQNDVYGQMMVSLLPLYTDRRFAHQSDKQSVRLVEKLLEQIEKTMDEPDAGLWEFRNQSQKHCYTFLFHWVGSNAGAQIARSFGRDDLVERAIQLKKASSEQIEACYDSKRGVYTQAIGSPNLDASLLQLITLNYLDPNSEKARKHLVVLEEELRTPEGLFFRYKHADDFGAPETTFLVCAYWYVEALAAVGRVDEAIIVFNNLLKYANHLGLLSEDVEAKSGSQWGNFPQTYSHVGLMNAAFRIARKLDRPSFLD